MVKYRCGICSREFSTPGGLRQHANVRHHGRTSLSQRSYTRPQLVERSEHVTNPEHVPVRPEHDESLWNIPIAIPRLQPQYQAPMFLEEETPVGDHDVNVVEDVISISEPRHNLNVEMEENIEDNNEESEKNSEELEMEEIEFNLEDF
ncbi:hypothetical protein RhiirA4_488514 [Rhizophagus irregularis]|uniref:C2H2-type domain-containing protein n=2 Tax=Rhizophagus irregularis TaxID=588596 RepID=A0A2I1HTR4_9GLOM|nr:hypothetical protein RhiirA4_488514 [Rhizophagus irregularis]